MGDIQQYIHFSVNFPNDRRLKKLERRAGVDAFMGIVTLILRTGTEYPPGDLSRYDDADIEALADWNGDEGKFVQALRDADLLDRTQLANDFWYRGKLPPRHISPAFRKNRKLALQRDGGICRYCKRPTDRPFCDHFYPHSKGGGDELQNLRTACGDCNSSKGDSDPYEWAKRKGYAI